MTISADVKEQGVSTVSEIPWKKVYDLVLSCGSIHSPKEFAIELVRQAQMLVPFDHARIYFVNERKRIYDQYLIGIDPKWVTAYLEYYSQIEDGRYNIFERVEKNAGASSAPVLGTVDWSTMASSEFTRDYIRPMGLRYSLGFNLFDTDGSIRAMFMLDRCTPPDFSASEIITLRLALPQLDNLHRNFYSNLFNVQSSRQIDWGSTGLTRREIEISTLLCRGIAPAEISKKLHIAPATTYKHIAHIYQKMHVSSRQELLVKLYNQI